MGRIAKCEGCGREAELERIFGLEHVEPIPGVDLQGELNSIGERCLACWKKIFAMTAARAAGEAAAAHPLGRVFLQAGQDYLAGRKAREAKEKKNP